jgi:hypothetical protein
MFLYLKVSFICICVYIFINQHIKTKYIFLRSRSVSSELTVPVIEEINAEDARMFQESQQGSYLFVYM